MPGQVQWFRVAPFFPQVVMCWLGRVWDREPVLERSLVQMKPLVQRA